MPCNVENPEQRLILNSLYSSEPRQWHWTKFKDQLNTSKRHFLCELLSSCPRRKFVFPETRCLRQVQDLAWKICKDKVIKYASWCCLNCKDFNILIVFPLVLHRVRLPSFFFMIMSSSFRAYCQRVVYRLATQCCRPRCHITFSLLFCQTRGIPDWRD